VQPGLLENYRTAKSGAAGEFRGHFPYRASSGIVRPTGAVFNRLSNGHTGCMSYLYGSRLKRHSMRGRAAISQPITDLLDPYFAGRSREQK
jgi:hypothetical protein